MKSVRGGGLIELNTPRGIEPFYIFSYWNHQDLIVFNLVF